tara:strand:- start:319 stop:540 length:222 start_codon:yes stop_codon:yes gene_type:complete
VALNTESAVAAEYAIRVLGEPPKITVHLVMPVIEPREFCDALNLIFPAAAPTASVGFLQGNQVKRPDQICDVI